MAFAAPLMIAMTLGSAAMSAYGAYEQGQATSAADKYNAQLASKNALVAKQNATIAGQSGEAKAAASELHTRAATGAIKANEAASGVDVNSGSAVDVQSSAGALGELDALTVRSNATREAFGYETQGENLDAQSALDRSEAANASTSGTLNAASTILGAAGQAGSQFANWQLAGGGGGLGSVDTGVMGVNGIGI